MNAITYGDQILPEVGYGAFRLDEFCRDSLRNRSWPYLVWLAAALVISSGVYVVYRGASSGAAGPMQLVYYFVVAVHLIRRLKAGGSANVLAPDVVFLLFYTLFHLGYVTLYSLNVVPYSEEVFVYASSIPKTLFVINLGLISFLVGYEMMGRRVEAPAQSTLSSIPGASWGILGIGLMILALVMHFLGLMTLGFDTIQRYGYAAIAGAYRYTPSYFTVLMLTESTTSMVMGLVIYLICSSLRYGKLFNSKLALGLTIAFMTIVLLEGERGTVLKLGLPLLMIRHYFIKRVKIRYLTIFFIAAITVFAGLAVVRKTVFKPSAMFAEYKYQKQAGQAAWYSAFTEMGQSFLVVNITCNDIPSVEPYWRGASWASAAIHTVPFLQGYAMRRGWIRWEPSKWITTTYYGPERSGRAFTVVGEGYLNFGYVGAFAELLLLGLFIRWLTVRFSRNPSAMWALIMFGCLGPSIMVIRNHFNLLTPPCVLVIVAALLINSFLGQEWATDYEDSTSLAELDLAHS